MFGKDKKQKRFTVKEEHSLGLVGGVVYILVDNETGVNYLHSPSTGMTPLLDSEGKVVIDSKN